jgi:hypothetical protein
MTNRTTDTSQRRAAIAAGLTFLFYIAIGITNMVLFNQATNAEGTAATLVSIAQHATTMRLSAVLDLLMLMDAIVLAVALYVLTRDQDPDLAVLALCCRAMEGVIAIISAIRTLGLLSVATTSAVAGAPDAAAANALGALLLKQGGWGTLIGATCFAVGSTLYCYLFLRARSIPVPLAWLGLLASVLLVVALPLQLVGFLRGPVTYFAWIPMTVFEVTFALWLIIRGARIKSPRKAVPSGG